MDYTLHHQGLFGESYLEPHPQQTETFQVNDIVQVKQKYKKMYKLHNIGYPSLKYKVNHVWEPSENDTRSQVNIQSIEEVVSIMENPFRSEFRQHPSYDFVDIGWLEKTQP